MSHILINFYSALQSATSDDEAVRGQFPFVGSLVNHKYYRCGAVLLAKDWILTSANCLAGTQVFIFLLCKSFLKCLKCQVFQVFKGLQVRFGKTRANDRGRVFLMKECHIHPRYNSTSFDYDIALCKSRKAIQGNNIKPIKLTRNGLSRYRQNGLAVGWSAHKAGYDYALSDLHYSYVKVSSSNWCKSFYGNRITNR